MRGRSVRRTTCLMAALAMLATIAIAQPIPEPGSTRVVSLTGTLTVTRLRQDPRPLRLHDAVQSGDELATGENSQAVLRSADGSTVIVYPDSRLVFNERSADVRELLHLFLGSIKVHIEKISGRPNPHKMTTPTAVIAVRGTTFSVFVDDTDSTLVAVEEGEVAVSNTQLPGQEVVLRAGQRTWVRPGQAPQQARAFQGPSERADLARGIGRGREAAGMQQMDTMMGSRGMGAISARTNPPH
jgi:hypothetical protein